MASTGLMCLCSDMWIALVLQSENEVFAELLKLGILGRDVSARVWVYASVWVCSSVN